MSLSKKSNLSLNPSKLLFYMSRQNITNRWLQKVYKRVVGKIKGKFVSQMKGRTKKCL